MKNRSENGFVPALRYHALTPAYDVIVRLTTREQTFRSLLLDAAGIDAGETVLDLGCGTGTLLKAITARQPSARLTGLDADPAILKIAAAKLTGKVELVQGFSGEMPFRDDSFDHVVSTLFFHHLAPGEKRRTASEIARVLRPGGALHVADWGPPGGMLQRLAFLQVQCLDGFSTTRDHVSGAFLDAFSGPGFSSVEPVADLRTMLGTLVVFTAHV